MKGKLDDLTGRRFGQLDVLQRAPNAGKNVQWVVVCGCGTIKSVLASNLRSGRTLSCGCKQHPYQSAEERFWSHVRKSEDCWEWVGIKDKKNYGLFYLDDHVHAHRASWIITYGPIPEGLCVLHKCDNPPCVRPDHLFLGSKADNVRDMDNKGRRARNGPNAKLAPGDVLLIRSYLTSGVSRSAVAEDFNVAVSTVDHIAQRRTWKQL